MDDFNILVSYSKYFSKSHLFLNRYYKVYIDLDFFYRNLDDILLLYRMFALVLFPLPLDYRKGLIC